MAEQAQIPDEPDAAAPASFSDAPVTESIIEDHVETVRVRRAPKFSVFLIVGAGLGSWSR